VRLAAPRVRVVRTSAAAFNFSDILAPLAAAPKPAAAPPPPPPAGAPPPRFSLNNLRLIDGELRLEDRTLGSSHQIAGLDVGVPFVSTLPVFVDTFVEPGLQVKIDGAPFVIAGRTKPFKDSLETTLEVRVANLDLTRFLPYVPVQLQFDVVSALLNLGLDVSFVRPRADAPTLAVKGKVTLDKVEARHRGGAPLVGWRQLEVSVRNAEVTARRFDVERVALRGLELHARRLPNGRIDLQDLLPPGGPEAPEDPAADRTAPPRFTVGEVSLAEATVHLRDQAVRPAVAFTVDQLSLSVKGLSNTPGARAQVALGLRATPGGTLRHDGTLTLEPLAATGAITLEGLLPARFAPYYRDLILFDVVEGRVRLGAGYQFTAGAREPKVALTDAHAEISDLVLHRRAAAPKDDFLRLGSLVVKGVSVDVARRSVAVGQIASRELKLRAARDAAGVLDLTLLVPPAKAPARAPAPAAGPPWTVTVAAVDIDRWGAHFEDRAVEPRAVIDVAPIALTARDVGTAAGKRASVDLRMGLNKQERLLVAGSAALSPPAADLRIDLRSLELLPLQPYFEDQVTLTVTDGTISTKGHLRVAIPAAPRAGTAPPPRVDFTGDVEVAGLATLDGQDREPLLGWKLLRVAGIEVSTVPERLAIREVALTDLRSRLQLGPDGKLNVEAVVPPPKAPAPAPRPAAAAPAPAATPAAAATKAAPAAPITIGQVTLAGAQVTFSDRSIRPTYSTALTDLTGKISGLSSAAGTQAEVDLRGSIDRTGALTIAGKVNPLAKELFLDVKVALEDLELPPASPYAGKYAGYGISKGKLDLALDYQIANSRLEAKNHLLLDQFTFGEKVPSPDATGLPVRLAVALLKDRHGVIDLDVPIAGSLDDPEFKVGRAILRVIGNLIVKAATSPFSLIASAFGGEELSRLDFTPGLARLEASSQEKVRTLAKALRERPGLSFEIEGGADPQRDRTGLRRHLFERKLRAQRALELVKEGAAVPSPDDLRLDPADHNRLLEKAYQAETFPKPKSVLGLEKSLPPAEMERLMLENTVVSEDALRTLAQERANAVLAAISKAEPSARDRLFLVTPRVTAKAGQPGNTVELRLRD
jgi:hypothetical protein